MRWITQGKVRASAKTEQRAKECSELHWWQLWNCTEGELKQKVRQYKCNNMIISTAFCGLCERHLSYPPLRCTKNAKCPLKYKQEVCCLEYSAVHNVYYDWFKDPTPANFQAFQKKAKIMWRKIKNLKTKSARTGANSETGCPGG